MEKDQKKLPKKKVRVPVSRFIALLLLVSILSAFVTSRLVRIQYLNTNDRPTDLAEEILQVSRKETSSTPRPDVSESEASILDELVKIRAELRAINQLLGITKTPEELAEIIANWDSALGVQTEIKVLGYLTISEPTLLTTNLLQEPVTSSRTVGQIKYGASYPFTQKQGNWYQVLLDNNTSGWVNTQYVTETNQLP